MPDPTPAHYRRPGLFTRHVFNRVVAGLTHLGVSVWGSRVLEVRGRTTGEPRRVPVNLLRHEGHDFLVAPRGETQWVRNVRAGGGRVSLLLGRHRDDRVARELADDAKAEVLRAYLRRWQMETGAFFDGVTADSGDAELQRIAPRHPVFELLPA